MLVTMSDAQEPGSEIPATKARILGTSSELFARQGYTGTGMNQIAARASAALGSIYHFFPGGKDQLCAEAIRSSGQVYLELIDAVLGQSPDIVQGVRGFFSEAGAHLIDTGYADACPIATIALEVASGNEELRQATAAVFEQWIEAASRRLVLAGLTPDEARRLSTFAISALEGAFVLSRARRTVEAIDVAGALVADAISAALRAPR
jgi:AcrR family transcriptional regulator